MALRHEGEYCYGDSSTDVWDYFVWRMRNSPEPVRHWRQAVCPCGCAVFVVEGDEDGPGYRRTCVECETDVVMFEREWSKPKKLPSDLPVMECVCSGEEFEVVGATAPFMGDAVSAKWFYLGLRCVGCGCLGEYASWIPRYDDAEAYLAML